MGEYVDLSLVNPNPPNDEDLVSTTGLDESAVQKSYDLGVEAVFAEYACYDGIGGLLSSARASSPGHCSADPDNVHDAGQSLEELAEVGDLDDRPLGSRGFADVPSRPTLSSCILPELDIGETSSGASDASSQDEQSETQADNLNDQTGTVFAVPLQPSDIADYSRHPRTVEGPSVPARTSVKRPHSPIVLPIEEESAISADEDAEDSENERPRKAIVSIKFKEYLAELDEDEYIAMREQVPKELWPSLGRLRKRVENTIHSRTSRANKRARYASYYEEVLELRAETQRMQSAFSLLNGKYEAAKLENKRLRELLTVHGILC